MSNTTSVQVQKQVQKVKRRSKRYRELEKLYDTNKLYTIEEAVDIMKRMANTKFVQTVDIVMFLNIDPKKAEQLVRGSVGLPHATGKTKKVLVFAEGDDVEAAKKAGADYVGSAELIAQIQNGFEDFDVAIAPQYMMPKISKIGKILGPKGKMPSPKTGTVTNDITTAVKEFKAGRVEYRNDAFGNIHCGVGKIDMSKEALVENIRAFINHISSRKPPGVKGSFIKKICLSLTMSPSINIKI